MPQPRAIQSINKDTTLCISLAGRPGNFGTRFHNFLYAELNLDYVYKAFTTTDLAAAIGGVRALGIRGCAVSMPFKEACIPLLDELTPSAAIGSVNTIVNDGGFLRAYNTDYLAVRQLIAQYQLAPETPFALRGSGGMAKAVAAAFRDAGFGRGVIAARHAEKGSALARECGYSWQAELGEFRPELLINVTPIGMAGGAEAERLAFEADAVAHAQLVFDVVALPAETPLIRAARAAGKRVISGAEVASLQALEQFVLYTGVRPSPEQAARAAAFAHNTAAHDTAAQS
ncbi:shikimate 5-dehydrogenase [Deinococcus psychrotolerans]|uniref:Shikimate 5-dehydrogenase n=1 Tax=Deinococcus psychrotolerans TaxID=2489213 RepID=A0A3G8Y980_9DEIO|nr:shikimate 5-dehydrogenase [Deinococcus psychrotolerans]AZI41918.1 shikimate 5-dehydrogenase [Deinococcus psychrotolerans]